jgi:hypothetical protein
MSKLQMSITSLMVAIVVAACGFAILHLDLTHEPFYLYAHTLVVGVLPMACLLTWGVVVGLISLFRRGECSAFLVGFEVFGWAAVLLFVTYTAAVYLPGETPLGLVVPLLVWWDGRDAIPKRDPSVVLFTMGIFLAPQLAVSLLGGLLGHALGIRGVRDRRGEKTG